MCHPMTQIRRRVKTYLFITICIHRNKEFCQLQIEFHATYYCVTSAVPSIMSKFKKNLFIVLHLLCHLSCQSVTSAVPSIMSKCYICCCHLSCQSLKKLIIVLHLLCHLSCQSFKKKISNNTLFKIRIRNKNNQVLVHTKDPSLSDPRLSSC